jgi:hypothetical protein
MAVWMDSINDSDLIPTWKNAVIAKVTRISMEDEDDDDDDFHAPAAAPAPVPVPVPSNPRAPPSHQSSMASQGSSEHLDIFDGPAPVSSTPAPAATGNLFDTHAAAPASGGSLLDMNDNYGRQAQPAASTAHADFLGMTATAAPQGQPGYPAAAAPNMYQAQQQRAPQQQQPNTFNNFSNQQSAFGGLGTPWKP